MDSERLRELSGPTPWRPTTITEISDMARELLSLRAAWQANEAAVAVAHQALAMLGAAERGIIDPIGRIGNGESAFVSELRDALAVWRHHTATTPPAPLPPQPQAGKQGEAAGVYWMNQCHAARAELEQAKAENAKLLHRLELEQAEHIAIEEAKAAPPASAQRGGEQQDFAVWIDTKEQLDRDRMWCIALCATLDTHDIEAVTRHFNQQRVNAAKAAARGAGLGGAALLGEA